MPSQYRGICVDNFVLGRQMTVHWMYDVLPISSIGGLWEVSSVFVWTSQMSSDKNPSHKEPKYIQLEGAHWCGVFGVVPPTPRWPAMKVIRGWTFQVHAGISMRGSEFVQFSLDDKATLLIKSGVILVGNEECCWKLGFPSKGGERAISYGGGQGWICKIHEKQFAWRSWKIERNLHGKSETLHNSFKGPCGCLTAEKGVRPSITSIQGFSPP